MTPPRLILAYPAPEPGGMAVVTPCCAHGARQAPHVGPSCLSLPREGDVFGYLVEVCGCPCPQRFLPWDWPGGAAAQYVATPVGAADGWTLFFLPGPAGDRDEPRPCTPTPG